MRLAEIIILYGAACVSPMSSTPQETVVHRVPCATVVYDPIGNPYKIAQEPNAISVAPQQAGKKVAAKKAKKKSKRKKRKA